MRMLNSAAGGEGRERRKTLSARRWTNPGLEKRTGVFHVQRHVLLNSWWAVVMVSGGEMTMHGPSWHVKT